MEQANKEKADAIIIGCFDDTGLDEARAISKCPVVGIGQAAYHYATLASDKFSVVTTLAVSIPVLQENIKKYGLDKHVVRVRASGVPVLDLEGDRINATAKLMAEVSRCSVL